MEQIYLKEHMREANNVLKGKSVKDVSYTYDLHNERWSLIIVFTDDTYIYLSTYLQDDGIKASVDLKNHHPVPPESYGSAIPGGIVIDGTFKYPTYMAEEIRLGLIKANPEKELERITEAERKQKQFRYLEYIKLKKEFENEK